MTSKAYFLAKAQFAFLIHRLELRLRYLYI